MNQQRSPSFFLLCTLILSMAISLPSHSNENDDSDLFTFVRLRYTGNSWYGNGWDVDLPASDRNFIRKLAQATNIPVVYPEKIISVGSPELFNYPFAYILEVGTLNLTNARSGEPP